MKGAIVIKDLHYAYGRAAVLQEIALTVQRGDFFVILGPNGSGKTTLIKIIAGVLPLQSGEMLINGRHLQAYKRRVLARTVAYVPQMLNTDVPFKVRELVLMGRTPHLGILAVEQPRDYRLAEEAMAYTEVAGLAERRLDQLSSGECQRVLIARAICQKTDILLMDEPTAALDLAHQVRLMDLMERLREEMGITVVMVSHDINLAAMYGSHLLLLQNGEIIAQGAPQKVLSPDTLQTVYGCRLMVDESPMGGFPRVTLISERHSH
jgi:iron complex transport system ATP-binding protein